MVEEMLPINHVRVGTRHRKDMGDIAALAASIQTIGLLNPIIVDKDNNLVAGERRLTACRNLGWPNVPVRRVRQITDAVTALIAERDENTCREDFKPSESVALGMALEEMERPAAEARRLAALKQNATDASRGGESPPREVKGKTRDIVAPAVGMKPSRYAHAKAIVVATEDPDPEVAAVAKEAMAEMDEKGNVDSAYRKVTAARNAKRPYTLKPVPESRAGGVTAEKVAKAREMAAAGYTSRQIGDAIGVKAMGAFNTRHGIEVPADAVVGKTGRFDGDRAVGEAVSGVEAIAFGIAALPINYEQLDRNALEGWVSSLSESLRSLTTLRNNLKKELTPDD